MIAALGFVEFTWQEMDIQKLPHSTPYVLKPHKYNIIFKVIDRIKFLIDQRN